MDDFDVFCAQAGRRRRLSSCAEYGGSLPCFPATEGEPNQSKALFQRVSPSIRRVRSTHGDRRDRHPVSPGSFRQNRSGRIWTSIKNFVESCQPSPPTRPKNETFRKCTSAPLSRSVSARRPRRARNQEFDGIRPRTASLPSKRRPKRPDTLSIDHARGDNDSEESYRVRNFVITPKGIINRGDSFRSRSTSSIRSLGSCGSGPDVDSYGSIPSVAPPVYRVLILGAPGVGKTALAQQFSTSECMGQQDCTKEEKDEEDTQITVSVTLDEEDATIEFTDILPNEDYRVFCDMDAYLITYSIVDRLSFHHAIDLLHDIRKVQEQDVAVILVANKTDLVRTRVIASGEGRSVATTYDCKYIEVSAVMNLKMDDLLVGILRQIRLHQEKKQAKMHDVNEGAKSPRGLLDRFLKKQAFRSRSCDNLLEL